MAIGIGTVGLGIAAVGTLGKAAYGLYQNHKAAGIEASNHRPVMGVNPLYQQNVDEAGIMAQAGTPTQEYNIGEQNIQRNLNGGLSTIQGGSNPAGVISLVRAANDANSHLDAQSAIQRNRNLVALMQQRGILAAQQDKANEYNNEDKYSEKLAESQALRGAGAQNIGGAFNDASQEAEIYNTGRTPNSGAAAIGKGFFGGGA